MSFVLPGNARQLRFTGEAKALKDENSSGGPGAGVALGKPRVRKPTTPPPTLPQATSRPRSITGATPASPGGNLSSRPGPGPGSYNSPSIRAKGIDRNDVTGASGGWDGEDQQATMAFDREGNDVLPGHHSQRPRAPAVPSVAPIPHFRPANPAIQTVIVPNQTGSTDARSKGAPLALWIFAAILAGVLSYHVTPAVMTHFEPPPAKAGG